jgi:hypothetical protein
LRQLSNPVQTAIFHIKASLLRLFLLWAIGSTYYIPDRKMCSTKVRLLTLKIDAYDIMQEEKRLLHMPYHGFVFGLHKNILVPKHWNWKKTQKSFQKQNDTIHAKIPAGRRGPWWIAHFAAIIRMLTFASAFESRPDRDLSHKSLLSRLFLLWAIGSTYYIPGRKMSSTKAWLLTLKIDASDIMQE